MTWAKGFSRATVCSTYKRPNSSAAGLAAAAAVCQFTWKIRFEMLLCELSVLYTSTWLCCTAAWYAAMGEHFPTFFVPPNENRMGERLTWLDVNAAVSRREYSYLARVKMYSRSHCWGSHASCVCAMRTGCSLFRGHSLLMADVI